MRYNVKITQESGHSMLATHHGWAKKEAAIRKFKTLKKKGVKERYKVTLVEQEKR